MLYIYIPHTYIYIYIPYGNSYLHTILSVLYTHIYIYLFIYTYIYIYTEVPVLHMCINHILHMYIQYISLYIYIYINTIHINHMPRHPIPGGDGSAGGGRGQRRQRFACGGHGLLGAAHRVPWTTARSMTGFTNKRVISIYSG